MNQVLMSILQSGSKTMVFKLFVLLLVINLNACNKEQEPVEDVAPEAPVDNVSSNDWLSGHLNLLNKINK